MLPSGAPTDTGPSGRAAPSRYDPSMISPYRQEIEVHTSAPVSRVRKLAMRVRDWWRSETAFWCGRYGREAVSETFEFLGGLLWIAVTGEGPDRD
jgi:hypothetical protein